MDTALNHLTPEQATLREGVARLCADFNDDYWLAQDRSGDWPRAFFDAMAAGGWLGIAMPEAVGGAGLGITEAAIMLEAVAASGGGLSAASAIHGPVFGLEPVVRFGSAAQAARMVPPILSGAARMCFAITEPNTGLDTTALKTRAEKVAGGYRVNGEKIWITNAHVADHMLLIARTTAREDVAKKTDGLTLFYTALDRNHIEHRVIPKMGRHAVASNMLFITDLFVPEEDRIGAEGEGFRILLQGLNPERILLGAEAVGLGRVAIARASAYARERVVFGRPIGQNQGIQHPLAKAWMALEAAWLMVLAAARRFDAGEECGIEANAAKYLAAEAGFEACQTAVMSMGGMGYAQEYHVERYLREVLIPRIVPVSPHQILNFIAERALALPRSY